MKFGGWVEIAKRRVELEYLDRDSNIYNVSGNRKWVKKFHVASTVGAAMGRAGTFPSILISSVSGALQIKPTKDRLPEF